MADMQVYRPQYLNSRALVIGVNKYRFEPPLAYARNDAQAFSDAIVSDFGFASDNVELLLDEHATKSAIMETFLRFAKDPSASADDRIVVFFAGHGHTEPGRRGEIGFLVPVDGKSADLSTLIRWDELTRNSELIPAKHILFIMDACYGGLALSRKPASPGSMRFLRDMLQRYSRQVLTAGKGDEPVSDGHGTRPGHSIFTSHVLDALSGSAASEEGIITASRVMAYVQDKVGNDAQSQQTPHYGYVDGDGDFIFTMKGLEALSMEDQIGTDLLIRLTPDIGTATNSGEDVGEKIKTLLSDPTLHIRLDDFVSSNLKQTLRWLEGDEFPVSGPISNEMVVERIARYESAIEDLRTITIMLSRWADTRQLALLGRLFARLADAERSGGGITIWINLAWYPVFCLMYAGGIAALADERFDSLAAILTRHVQLDSSMRGQIDVPLLMPVVDNVSDVSEHFKLLPGRERNFAPVSEHLFSTLQSPLEEALFLGRSYEGLFDRFEIILALAFADERDRQKEFVWGPPGRFAWKYRRGHGASAYDLLVSEAKKRGNAWGPLVAGMFQGSIERFVAIADAYKREVLDQLRWR
ncbi:caspase family protein [Reyranella sp.]|uniref:caspase family protein n=1 Tax=Reyranella sp. TaxID=1929291 RepID=UPI003D0AAF79